MDVQTSRNDLQPCFNRLKNLLNTLNGYTKYEHVFEQQLRSLESDLKLLNEILTQLFVNCQQKVTTGDLSVPFNNSIIQQNSVIINLINNFDKYDATFSHLLDIMELNEYENHFDIVIDLIESCNFTKNKLQPLLTNLKVYIDIILEYHEILNDNMKTLDTIINENIDEVFSLQDIKNASPIRHVPSFTLKQLVNILSKNCSTTTTLNTTDKGNITSQLKLPKFSSLEEKLINKFVRIQNNLRPIETSLLEILPQRLHQFEKRHHHSNKDINIQVLIKQLKWSYKEIFQNFKFLNSEVNSLKKDLIDKRWNIIFANLNHELEFLINELERNYRILLKINDNISSENSNTPKNPPNEVNLTENNDILSTTPLLSSSSSYNISGQLKLQMERTTTTISRTFDVIYAASEFALLDENIANRTNELAQNWIHLRTKSDKLSILIGNELKSQQSIKMETKRETSKSNESSFLDIGTLEPPRPLLSITGTSRRSSNTSFLSNGSDSESDAGNRTIEAIANDLRKFSIASGNPNDNNSDNDKNEVSYTDSNRKNTKILKKHILTPIAPKGSRTEGTTPKSGAQSLERTYTKPILISTSNVESVTKDNDNEKNPFFDSKSAISTIHQTDHLSKANKKTQRRQKTRSLILSTLPPLIHESTENNIKGDYLPDILKESMSHAVSSSLTMLGSPLSLKQTSINDIRSASCISDITNNNDSDLMDSTTVETIVLKDSENHQENWFNDFSKNEIPSNTPIGHDISDQMLLQTTIAPNINDSMNAININDNSHFDFSSSTSSSTKNEILQSPNNSPKVITTKMISSPQQEELVTHISSGTFNKLLDEKIAINRKKPSIIPRIKNTKTSLLQEHTTPINLLRNGRKVFLSKRIPTPTPLSKLLTQRSKRTPKYNNSTN